MAIYGLKNETVEIQIQSKGAELKSLKRRSDGTEYLWNADPAFWGRTSPVLFPFVGGVKNKEYRTKGQTFSMGQHGFARDMEFALLSQTNEEIWFELVSSEETLARYPYQFALKLGYRIEGRQVIVQWKVENPGRENLPFSIGGHPAFYCPIDPGTSQSECFVDFGDVDEIASTRISEKGLAAKDKDVYRLTEGRLALEEHLFDHDALVVEDRQTNTVSLCGKDKIPYLKVIMDAPLFGVWSPPGKKAPFVCIEPWYGRCDDEDFEGTLEERKWGNLIGPGGTWSASYVIEV